MTGISVKFWGVRGSHPVPGPDTLHFGGNTSCIEIRLNERTIILDAGTGIIGLGRSLLARPRQPGEPLEVTVLFSHLHHDHTQGFLFFAPAYMPFARLHLLGPGVGPSALEDTLSQTMQPPVFPIMLKEMRAAIAFTSLTGNDDLALGESGSPAPHRAGEALAGVVRIRTLRSYAHPGGVMVYRIEQDGCSIVYATDTEGYVGADTRLVNFAQGADLLIHDAQYTEEHYRGQKAGLPVVQGFGHSTPQIACEVAQAAGVKQLVLFHHDPNYNDAVIAANESQARAYFKHTRAAYEGLEITLGQPGVKSAVRSKDLARSRSLLPAAPSQNG